MRILADENVDASIVRFLRGAGHDVLWMVEHGPGTADDEILRLAHAQGRIVVTFDRDFGELIFRDGQAAAGVVLLRMASDSPEGILNQFRNWWPRIEKSADGRFIVVAKGKMRVRPIPRTSS